MEKLGRIARTGCAVVLVAGVAWAQDWPQWRGPHRDGKTEGFSVPQKWPTALTQAWRVTVGLGDATPALVGGKLYVFARQGGDEVTACLNADDGQVVWQDKYATEPATGPSGRDHPGPRSSPVVTEGKAVTLGVRGVFSCLDSDTGVVRWRHDPFAGAVPRFFTAFSPIVVDGLAIAHFGKEGGGSVIAYDLSSGQEKWHWDGDGPTYASPVTMTVDGVKQVVMLTENDLIGLAVSDGALLWKVAVAPQRRFYSSATPIVDGQIVIYTGQGTGTRALKVEKQGDSFATTEIWANADLGTGYNTPVLKDSLIFGISDPGNHIYCLDARNGKALWTDTIRYGRFGTIVDAGPVLLALPTSALIVLKPSAESCKELARYPVADSQVYAYPVAAGKAIYIKDQENLTKWMIP